MSISSKLRELREALEESTRGPWRQTGATISAHDHSLVAECQGWCRDNRLSKNAALIVAAKNHFPAMLDVIESGEKLATYVEECYPGLHVTDEIRAALQRLAGVR